MVVVFVVLRLLFVFMKESLFEIWLIFWWLGVFVLGGIGVGWLVKLVDVLCVVWVNMVNGIV